MPRAKIRRLGDEHFFDVEHEVHFCPFCEAARMVAGSGVIFFEDRAGSVCVQRVEVEMAADRRCVMLCRTVTRVEAEAEIAAAAVKWKRTYRKHDVFPECLHWRLHGHSGPLCRFCEVVRDYP